MDLAELGFISRSPATAGPRALAPLGGDGRSFSRDAIHSARASSVMRMPVPPRSISRGPHPSRLAFSYVDLEIPTEAQNSSTVHDTRDTGLRLLFSTRERLAMTILLTPTVAAFSHLGVEDHARAIVVQKNIGHPVKFFCNFRK
jgi:hypothetical protein